MYSQAILKSALSAILALIMSLTGCNKSEEPGSSSADSTGSSESNAPENTTTEVNSMTSLEVIRAMGNGINLGNTLEAYNHQGYLNGSSPTLAETSWGQPTTTQEMIQGMKAAGFDTIRIPVAWTNGMYFESGDYTIDHTGRQCPK